MHNIMMHNMQKFSKTKYAAKQNMQKNMQKICRLCKIYAKQYLQYAKYMQEICQINAIYIYKIYAINSRELLQSIPVNSCNQLP